MITTDEPILDEAFTSCVASKYVAAYYEGRMRELSYSDPYQFAFLNDFWTPDFYRRISAFKPSLSNYYTSRTGYEIEIFYEPFFCEEFVRIVYGKVFRRFLGALMGTGIATRPEDKYPQIRTILSGKGGMGIHDDYSAPYNGVAFFNFNDDWQPSNGGELVIWEKLSGPNFKKRFQFPPCGNSMSVMKFCPHSYHSVNNPEGDWNRTNVLVELNFTEDLNANPAETDAGIAES